MPKYNVELATFGTATFKDVEADSEDEAIELATDGNLSYQHAWEYGHLVTGSGDDAEATELPKSDEQVAEES